MSYVPPSLSGYNASPPPDDGSTVASNQVTWAKHLTKLTDPLKTFATAINAAVTARFLFTPDYSKTDAEITAGAIIVNGKQKPGHTYRYGNNIAPGSSDMFVAIQTAIDVMKGTNAGIAVLPNERCLISAGLLADENVILKGGGPASIIEPNAETFAAIRLEAATDFVLNRWGLEDFHIKWASRATTSTAIGIKLDDSGGADRFPYGGHIHRVSIQNPYQGFFDDTVAFDIDLLQIRVTTPHVNGFFANKAASTMYTFEHCYAALDANCTGPGFDLTGIRYLRMGNCAVDGMDNTGPAVNIVSCDGVIETLDIEQCTTSSTSGLLSLSGSRMTVGGRFDTNVLSGDFSGVIYTTSGTELILRSALVSNTTGTAGKTTAALTIASNTTSVLIEGSALNATTGPGSNTDIIDFASIARMPPLVRSQVLTSAKTVSDTEGGKTFYLSAAGGFTVTLPAPAIGLKYKFIVKTAPTTAYIVTTDSGDNVLHGTLQDIVGEQVPITAQDTINFVASTSLVGDSLEVEGDGTNWHCVARSLADGGITAAVT